MQTESTAGIGHESMGLALRGPMRRLLAATLLGLALSACGGVQVRPGLPVLLKQQDGLLVSASNGPPDIQRGNQARQTAHLDEAERDLLPLAERGYAEAGIYLAATYAQRDTLGGESAAIRWYRAALAKRSDAALPLAKVLLDTGDRKNAPEALRLILQAQRERRDPLAGALLLQLYTEYPEFDPDDAAPGLAEAAAGSPLPDDRLAAINWFRANISLGDNGQRLQALCRENLQVAMDCYIDLARFLRYQDNRAGLEALTTRALAAFERGIPPPDPTDLYHQPPELPSLAAALAIAMVDQFDVEDAARVYEALHTHIEYEALDTQLEYNPFEAEGDGGPDGAATDATDATAASERMPFRTATAAPDLADRVLRWMLRQSGEYPGQAAAVAVRYPFLLGDIDLPSLLEPAAAASQHAAQLALGHIYMSGLRAPLNPGAAEKNLLACLSYRSTKGDAHLLLGDLYGGTLLGAPEPQRAVDNKLEAARMGKSKAYGDLAKFFFTAPGFQINRVYAYAFARRAEDGGYPVVLSGHVIPRATSSAVLTFTARGSAGIAVVYKLLDRLHTELSKTELARAESLYETERALQPRLRLRFPVDIYSRTVP